MTEDERKERNRILLKNQHRMIHVISDGVLAMMDHVEEQIPAKIGDELIINTQMKALTMALLCITIVDQTTGGQASKLAQLAEYFDTQADSVLDAIDDITGATGNAWTSDLADDRQVPFYNKPEYSEPIDKRPTPSIVIGNSDSEGHLLPQTDEIS